MWSKYVGGASSVGKTAGYVDHEGYYRVSFQGVRYYGHTLAWYHQTGEWVVGGIDHKNLVKSDNSFSNLRIATRSQNSMNTRKVKNTSSRFKGVTFVARTGRWQAQIQANGKRKHLGKFSSEVEAAEAYRKSAYELFGEFARFE